MVLYDSFDLQVCQGQASRDRVTTGILTWIEAAAAASIIVPSSCMEIQVVIGGG
jgi:hypothetical protein